jgi:N6-adenosine-specific RNA methylase IME4
MTKQDSIAMEDKPNWHTMRYHPVAAIFPLLEGKEFDAFVEDIRMHGLTEKIWLHPDESILDGRNRYRACLQGGIAPVYQTWNGSGSPLDFVLSMNLHRRHLTPSQKAALAVKIEPLMAEEARKRQATSTGGAHPQLTDKCRDAGRRLQRGRHGREATAQAGQALGVSGRHINRAKKLEKQDPVLFAEVLNGHRTLGEANRKLVEQGRNEKRERNRDLARQAPAMLQAVGSQVYRTIVLDPPWDWGDEGDNDQLGRARPTYATMSIDEIATLPVSDVAADDAHIYLWITNRSVPKGFALLDGWGFRYVTMLTWVKPSFGMGNYFRGSTEHVLFGVRGSLPLLRNDCATHFLADRPGKHSSKPPEFYAMVETSSPGPWLEMFARQLRPGWAAWGAEIDECLKKTQ